MEFYDHQKNDAPPRLKSRGLNRRSFHQGRESLSAVKNRMFLRFGCSGTDHTLKGVVSVGSRHDEDAVIVDYTIREYAARRTSTRKLQKLARQVDVILKEELEKNKVRYTFAEARILDCKTVGVQGDERTYGHPAKITIYQKKIVVWIGETGFLERLSSRITNEVRGVNRVIYSLARRERSV